MSILDSLLNLYPKTVDPDLQRQLESRGLPQRLKELTSSNARGEANFSTPINQSSAAALQTPATSDYLAALKAVKPVAAKNPSKESLVAKAAKNWFTAVEPKLRDRLIAAGNYQELERLNREALLAGVTATQLPSALAEEAIDLGKAIVRAPQRALASMALSPAAGILSLATGRKIEAKYTPKSKREQFIFGAEPIEGAQERMEKAKTTVQKFIESTGGKAGRGIGTEALSSFAAPVLMAGLLTADVLPVGGGEKKLAEEAGVKALGAIKPEVIAYADEMIRAGEAEAAKGGLLQKAKAALVGMTRELKRKLVDANAPIEDAIRTAQKEYQFEVLPKADITNQIDRVYRSPVLAGQFAREKGLVDVIKETPSPELFNQYLIAKQAAAVEKQGITTGRDLAKDAELVRELDPVYAPYAARVKEYSDSLLDYTVDSGLISKELAAKLKEIYPDYVPLTRILGETAEIRGAGNRAVASLSRQTVIERMQGSEKQIEEPLVSLLKKTETAFAQGEKNKAARILASYKDIPSNPLGLTALRTAENVKKRIALAEDLRATSVALSRQIRELSSAKKASSMELTNLRNAQRKVEEEERKLFNELAAFQGENDEIATLAREEMEIAQEAQMTKEALIFYDQEKEAGYQTFKELAARRKWVLDPQTDDAALKAKLKGVNVDNQLMQGASDVTNDELLEIFKERYAKEMNIELPDKGFLARYLRQEKRVAAQESRAMTAEEKAIDASIRQASAEDSVKYAEKQMARSAKERAEIMADLKKAADLRKEPGQTTISFLNDGIREDWLANEDVANAAKNLNAQNLGILGRIFAAPVRLLKAGATGLNVPFVAANVLKDTTFGFITTKHPTSLANPITYAKSLFEALGHGKLYDEMLRMGAGGTSFDIARNQARLSYEKLLASRSAAGKIKYAVTHPSELFRTAENILSRGEELSRIQQYASTKNALLKQGRTETDAMIAASRAARENTVNFYRKGEFGTVLNATVPYLNAGIQGARTLVRTMAERPARTAIQLAIALYTPVAVATAWNLNDPKRRAVWEDIADYEKEGNIIIVPPNPTKDPETNKWNVIKIPITPGLTKLAIPVRRSIEMAYGLDPVSAGDMANAMTFVSPVDIVESKGGEVKLAQKKTLSEILPQAAKPTLEWLTNMNLYYGRPIVAESKQELSPEYQYSQSTSGTARKIGELLGLAPAKVQAFVKGHMGEVGGQLLNASDRVLAKLDIIPRDQVKGKGILAGIVSRLAQATSGAQEDEATDKLTTLLTKQADERFILKTEAEMVYQELLKLPKDQKADRLQEIKTVNPDLFDKVKDTINDAYLGLTYADRLIKQLGVENGERAKYIWNQVKTYKTDDEKRAYLRELRRKKIISDEVLKQLNQLKKRDENPSETRKYLESLKQKPYSGYMQNILGLPASP